MTLFTAHYGLEEGRDLTRWRELLEFLAILRADTITFLMVWKWTVRKKRRINDKYKLFALGPLKKGIAFIGDHLEGARLCLIISSSDVDKLEILISIQLHMLYMCDLSLVLKSTN